ncbi:DUF6807 family protein [Caulobacter sp. 17J80-11]|uniref:DUF6807 family protein n=1 Tax=Caulobacter sp. 17J80-11 TaxID=2763502 RepID=UPI001653CA37|nr:DUF6807 family protein [Caulobacter sp. 17J80-11]MBC6982676.1 PmoA family protein [Caulobacter sp. 17J80-11]
MRPKSFIAALLAASALFAAPAWAGGPLHAEIGPSGVQILDEAQPVLFYRTAPVDAAAEPWRLNYVQPLYAPDGTVLTEDRPADHLHQRGVYWAWRRILKDGVQIGDTWVMKDVTFQSKGVEYAPQPDGSVRLTVKTDWVSTAGGEHTLLFAETTVVTVPKLKKGARKLAFDTTLTALQPGLALAGTDDEKEYSGFSVRFVHNDKLSFASDGKAVEPTNAVLAAGEALTFAWPKEEGLPNWKVTLACRAQGAPLNRWVLRRELSMQTCAFPGRTPYAVPVDRPLRLQAELTIAPAG